MRLPAKTQYACQVMAQLARTHGRCEVRRIDDLAAEEGLSANYLVQILNELRPAGLVVSKRGKHGGYQLARDPESITLADIAAAIEGESLIETSPGNGGMSAEKVADAWATVNAGALEAMTRISLAELVVVEDGAIGDWVI